MLREKIINSLANQIFETADWTSLNVKTDDIFYDLKDCLENEKYEAYPLILVD